MARPTPGEVWRVDLGLTAKVRPCLVMSKYPTEDELALVLIVPTASLDHRSNAKVAASAPPRRLRMIFHVYALRDIRGERIYVGHCEALEKRLGGFGNMLSNLMFHDGATLRPVCPTGWKRRGRECIERENECLKRISTDEVLNACRELLATTRNRESVSRAVNTTDRRLSEEAYRIAQRLRALSPERIYVFGSCARGQAGPDSDLDFLVVVPRSDLSGYHRAVEAHRLAGDTAVPKDIVVLTRAEWDKQIKAPSSLCSTVLREGVLINHES